MRVAHKAADGVRQTDEGVVFIFAHTAKFANWDVKIAKRSPKAADCGTRKSIDENRYLIWRACSFKNSLCRCECR